MADYIYKDEVSDRGMHPLTVAFLGAVAGAVGTGVAMALSNPQNRKKVQKTMTDSKRWVNKTISNARQGANEMGEKMADTADALSERKKQAIQEGTSEVKKTFDK